VESTVSPGERFAQKNCSFIDSVTKKPALGFRRVPIARWYRDGRSLAISAFASPDRRTGLREGSRPRDLLSAVPSVLLNRCVTESVSFHNRIPSTCASANNGSRGRDPSRGVAFNRAPLGALSTWSRRVPAKWSDCPGPTAAAPRPARSIGTRGARSCLASSPSKARARNALNP